MIDLFHELLDVIRTLDPPLAPSFRPPADPAEIDEAEATLGLNFPQDLRDLLLCANGQEIPERYSDPIFPCIRFRDGELGRTPSSWLLSVGEIVEFTELGREEYYEIKDDGPFEEIGPVRYHDQTINFTNTESAGSLCLDLCPQAGGNVGQVIMVSTQPSQVAVMAPDLRSFIRLIIDGFKTKRFLLDANDYYNEWTDPA